MDLSNKTLLVISPHPDDETLGCGGLIRKVKKAGGRVFVLIISVGDLEQYGKKSEANVRIREIDAVMKSLEVDGFHLAHISNRHHMRLDTIPEIELITLIERGTPVSLEQTNPDIVCLPFQHSYNQDHRVTHIAGFAAVRMRPKGIKKTPTTVLSYEQPDVHWPLQPFVPNLFVDITDELGDKLKALRLYASQIHPHPHPVSIENVKAIALNRGIPIGAYAGEAYVVHRMTL